MRKSIRAMHFMYCHQKDFLVFINHLVRKVVRDWDTKGLSHQSTLVVHPEDIFNKRTNARSYNEWANERINDRANERTKGLMNRTIAVHFLCTFFSHPRQSNNVKSVWGPYWGRGETKLPFSAVPVIKCFVMSPQLRAKSHTNLPRFQNARPVTCESKVQVVVSLGN